LIALDDIYKDMIPSLVWSGVSSLKVKSVTKRQIYHVIDNIDS
jgi:hypothetical protein